MKKDILTPEQIEIHRTDLSDPGLLESRYAYVKTRDDIDLLTNNAGFGLGGTFIEKDIRARLGMIHVHINASLALAHAVLPAMLANRQGWIISRGLFA